MTPLKEILLEVDAEIVDMFLDEALDSLSTWEKSCLDLLKNKDDISKCSEELGLLFRCAHNLKGASRCVNLNEFGDFVHYVEDAIVKMQKGILLPDNRLIQSLLHCEEVLRNWLECLRTNKLYKPQDEHFKITMQALLKYSGDENTGENQIMPENHNEPEKEFLNVQKEEEKEEKEEKEAEQTTIKSSKETIRVPARRLDELIQLIGELNIHSSILSHAREHEELSSQVASESISLLFKIAKDLQMRALEFRMQTLQPLLQRLERTAQSLAEELAKPIEVVVSGHDVELDKIVVEKILDPLVHMMRNSIDHGVESKADRMLQNKNTIAKIVLSASQVLEGVKIELSDDGKGLDTERIFRKAQENGLIPNDATQEQFSEREIFNFIFLAGFSTAEKVTSISGRGVGMEVVKKTVSELGGQIEIESKVGVGTLFRLLLPTNVSLVQAILINISKETYVVPLNQVEEIVNNSDFEVSEGIDGQKFFVLREKVIPMADLRKQLNFDFNLSKLLENKEERHPILVVKSNGMHIGILVDEVISQQQIVVRKLSGKLSKIEGFMGGTVLGDGLPGLILDIPYWAEQFLIGRKKINNLQNLSFMGA
jgi:two-component system, chemotaxis family, sensor kinase CheA